MSRYPREMAPGVDLQQRGIRVRVVQGLQRRRAAAGIVLVKQGISPIQLGHQVNVAQNGGSSVRHGGHIPGSSPLSGPAYRRRTSGPGRRSAAPVPVYAMVLPGLRVIEVVDGADPVVRPVRNRLCGPAVLLDTQQDLPSVRRIPPGGVAPAPGIPPGSVGRTLPASWGISVWLWPEAPKKRTPAAYAAAAISARVPFPSQRTEWVWTEQHSGVSLIASAPASPCGR